MPPRKIIKNNAIVSDDPWYVLEKDANDIPQGAVIVPFELWLEQKELLSQREKVGVWLDSEQSPKLIADSLDQFDIIAINFPAFTDGRGFTYGRELREQLQYQGDIRAIGDFMRDQLFYLSRCGFTSFAIENSDVDSAIESLSVFSDSYQAAIDQPKPLYRRR